MAPKWPQVGPQKAPRGKGDFDIPAEKNHCSRWGKSAREHEILILIQGIWGSGPFCSAKYRVRSQPAPSAKVPPRPPVTGSGPSVNKTPSNEIYVY